MSDTCELIDKCLFFANCRDRLVVQQSGWIKTYCENKLMSKNCMRKKVWRKTGKEPPENISPIGKEVL